MQAFNQRIEQTLQTRINQGLDRQLRCVEGGNQLMICRDNQQWLNFASNNYLGLANDDKVVLAWQQGLRLFGAGSGASPLVTGHSTAHQMLEDKLCDWLGFERAILFNSGFSANQALLFSLLEKGDVVFQDKLNHASLIEAAMLSPATLKRFAHNDVADLSQKLANVDAPSLVVTEGVFSMDGDVAPLKDIARIQGHALFVVDDAHGIGVLGEKGGGSCQAAGVKPNFLVVTFGKALGISGAAIMCDATAGDYLTQMARHFVYSTAMPPAQAYALTQAINQVQHDDWRRTKLDELSDYYEQRMCHLPGFRSTPTAIKPFIIGDSARVLDCAKFLNQHGIWLSAIRAPTVARHQARLRITLTALHEQSHIDQLAEHVERWLEVSA